MHIHKLTDSDPIDAFHSGTEPLDAWLRARALDNQRRGFSVTYVVAEPDEIVGYVAVTATHTDRKRIRRAQGPVVFPALLIARMAVSQHHQRKGIGSQLMTHALEIADAQGRLSGCAVIAVDAKPEAVAFYRGFDFRELVSMPDDEPTATKLYLDIERARRLLDLTLRS